MYQIQGKPYLIPEAFWGTCEAGYGFVRGCGVAVELYDQVREFSEKLLQNSVAWEFICHQELERNMLNCHK